MHEFSPARLGAAEPTLYDLLSQEKPKKPRYAHSIEEWVVCFNTYISVIALCEPQRVPDLLAYSFLVIQASRDYIGAPWRAYDIHFRKQAAAMKLIKWGEKDPSLWLSYFAPTLAKQRCEECGSFDHGRKDCDLVQENQVTKHQLPQKGTYTSQSTTRFNPYPTVRLLQSVRIGTGVTAHPHHAPTDTSAWNAIPHCTGNCIAHSAVPQGQDAS